MLVTLANKGTKPWSNILDYLASLEPLPSPPGGFAVALPSDIRIMRTANETWAVLQQELTEERRHVVPPIQIVKQPEKSRVEFSFWPAKLCSSICMVVQPRFFSRSRSEQ